MRLLIPPEAAIISGSIRRCSSVQFGRREKIAKNAAYSVEEFNVACSVSAKICHNGTGSPNSRRF